MDEHKTQEGSKMTCVYTVIHLHVSGGCSDATKRKI